VLKVFGVGINVDISVAGIMSYVDALNKIEYLKLSNIDKSGALNNWADM
jgi:hypothetical protein